MSNDRTDILERALARERAARKQAEKILEQKSAELYDATERLKESNIRLEELLQERTSELKGVFENIIDSYVVMDLKGNVLKMNDAANQLFGYNLENDGLNVMQLIYKQDLEYAMTSYVGLMEKGFFTNYKARIFTKDKQVKWVHINASLIYDEHQKPIAAQGIVRDITEAQKSAVIIEEQQQKLSAIVGNSSLGIILTQEGQIIQTNKAAQKLLKYSEEELLTMTVKDVSSPKDLEASMEAMKEMNEHNLDHFVMKKRYVKKDQSEVWAKTNVAAVRNDNGTIKYQVALVEDITQQLKSEEERKKLLENIEAQKQKYSGIIANMNLGLLEVDTNDTVLMANQSFEEMSGYAESDLIGKKASRLLLSKNSQEIFDQESVGRNKGGSSSYEVEAITKDGGKKYWLISGAPNYDVNGDVVGSIGIHLDITELKNLEFQKENLLKRLEKSNEELQEYAHIVSHDLKSPLRNIYALLEWIKEDNASSFNADTLQNITLIESMLEKMEQLISDVLAYSSISSEDSSMTKVDVNQVLDDVQQILLIPDTISVKTNQKLPVINGDKVKIQQVFQNLIGNAVRYMDKEEGLIEIDVVDKKGFYQFSVSDNGMGIDKKYHKKIFKIFQSLQQHEDSTGIGLAIVKKIVTMYHGEIWLESEPEQGTTFYFTFKK